MLEVSSSTHDHVDHTRSPDIHGSTVEFLVDVLFRGDIRSRAANTCHRMCVNLPGHAEVFGISEIADFEGAISGKEEVLRASGLGVRRPSRASI